MTVAQTNGGLHRGACPVMPAQALWPARGTAGDSRGTARDSHGQPGDSLRTAGDSLGTAWGQLGTAGGQGGGSRGTARGQPWTARGQPRIGGQLPCRGAPKQAVLGPHVRDPCGEDEALRSAPCAPATSSLSGYDPGNEPQLEASGSPRVSSEFSFMLTPRLGLKDALQRMEMANH